MEYHQKKKLIKFLILLRLSDAGNVKILKVIYAISRNVNISFALNVKKKCIKIIKK